MQFLEDRHNLCAVNIISESDISISRWRRTESRCTCRYSYSKCVFSHVTTCSEWMRQVNALKQLFSFHFPGIHLKYNEALRNPFPTRQTCSRFNDVWWRRGNSQSSSRILINAQKFNFELRKLPKQAKNGAAFTSTAACHQAVMVSNKNVDFLTPLVGESIFT